MDQRYERAVHDQLVEVTCKAESGQYFLITPKLLPGLQYHQSMKILCVNNGEWLPESTEPGVGNMQRMINNFLEHRRA
jgi:structural maintenance of chromosomes protein 5